MTSGTRGYLRVEDFVLPFAGKELSFEVRAARFEMKGGDFTVTPRCRRFTVAEHSQSHPSAQEANLFRNFSRQVRSGRLNDLWPEIALQTQIVMAACLDSARQDGRPVRPGGRV